jgi:hypothetical protein
MAVSIGLGSCQSVCNAAIHFWAAGRAIRYKPAVLRTKVFNIFSGLACRSCLSEGRLFTTIPAAELLKGKLSILSINLSLTC